MIRTIAACAVGIAAGFALGGLPAVPEGTWTSATAATRVEVRPGAAPSEIRMLAERLMENADYRERAAARERVTAHH